MVFISARTFAGRWIANPKPLVDNMLSVSRCYSSLNCINGARWSGELFVFLSVCMCVSERAWVGVLFVCMCVHRRVLASSKAFCFWFFLNRSDSTFGLSNVQEPGAKQWHQLKGLSSVRPRLKPLPHPPKTTCLRLRLHYPPLQHRPGAHCKIWHPHKGDILLQQKWIRLSKPITY